MNEKQFSTFLEADAFMRHVQRTGNTAYMGVAYPSFTVFWSYP